LPGGYQPPPVGIPGGLSLGAQNFQQPSYYGVPGQQGGQGQGMAGAGQITPPYLQQPGTPETPDLPPWVDPNAFGANIGTQLAPRQAALQEAYYPAAAGLLNDYQQAQMNTSLGWRGNQVARQNQLLRALQGI